MINLITDLDQAWNESDPDSYASLQTPFSDTQFGELRTLYKKELPEVIRTLYTWKGGQSALTERGLLPEWRLMQHSEIKMEYQSFQELFEMGVFDKQNWWRPEWIPFLVNTEGAVLCLDPIGVFEGEVGQIIFVSGDDPDRTAWFPGLESLLKAAIHSLQSSSSLQFPPGFPKAHQA